MKYLILILTLFAILISCSSSIKIQKELDRYYSSRIDSCVNCLFMGLTNEQWFIKDKPAWHLIDSEAVSRGSYHGLYIGDLPSQMGSFTIGGQGYSKSYVYHPSIDTTIIEEHFWVLKNN